MHYAVSENQALVLETLLDFGADPNTVSRDGQTPLYVAAASGSVECLQILHNWRDPQTGETIKTDGDEENEHGNWTPLHGAIHAEAFACIYYLVHDMKVSILLYLWLLTIIVLTITFPPKAISRD